MGRPISFCGGNPMEMAAMRHRMPISLSPDLVEAEKLVRFGLDSVIRVFCSGDSQASLSGRSATRNRTFCCQRPVRAIADVGQ
jgi:hypothetical protein